MPLIEEKATGLEIDRNRGTWEDELQRVKRYNQAKMGIFWIIILRIYIILLREEKNNTLNTLLGSYFIIAFLCQLFWSREQGKVFDRRW